MRRFGLKCVPSNVKHLGPNTDGAFDCGVRLQVEVPSLEHRNASIDHRARSGVVERVSLVLVKGIRQIFQQWDRIECDAVCLRPQ